MSHTPTPWSHPEPTQRNFWGHEVIGANGEFVCETNREMGQKVRAETDAKLIVKCVNAHDELVSMVESLIDALDNASTVVDAGENEEYAYQAELESARTLLAKLTGA